MQQNLELGQCFGSLSTIHSLTEPYICNPEIRNRIESFSFVPFRNTKKAIPRNTESAT
jgi:hypothetical protein